jgi:hypothetical protein
MEEFSLNINDLNSGEVRAANPPRNMSARGAA